MGGFQPLIATAGNGEVAPLADDRMPDARGRVGAASGRWNVSGLARQIDPNAPFAMQSR
jgi:hypothetical protein